MQQYQIFPTNYLKIIEKTFPKLHLKITEKIFSKFLLYSAPTRILRKFLFKIFYEILNKIFGNVDKFSGKFMGKFIVVLDKIKHKFWDLFEENLRIFREKS